MEVIMMKLVSMLLTLCMVFCMLTVRQRPTICQL